MLLPPSEILRSEALPANAVVVVRGGERSLEDAQLDRAVADCWTDHGFFGLSVIADPSSTAQTFAEVRRCFGSPIPNPGYTPA